MSESTPPISEDADVANLLLSLSSSSSSSSSAVDREAESPRGGIRRSRSAKEYECSECSMRFRSGWALGGHMKKHCERDLKGRVVKKKMRKISSLGLGFGVERDLN